MKANTFWIILGLLFITLKLCGIINWSWWFVLLPYYGWYVIAIILFGISGLIQLCDRDK